MAKEETVTVKLPAYAKMAPQVKGLPPVIVVDAELMYAHFLSAYDVGNKDRADRKVIDQYWLEVCYQSMKLQLQLVMGTFGFSIHVQDVAKKYAQKKFPPGRGVVAATKGKEARQHFQARFGALPRAHI